MKNSILSYGWLFVFLFSLSSAHADVRLEEYFTSTSLPAGWTNTPATGTATWIFTNGPAMSSSSGGGYAVFNNLFPPANTEANVSNLTSPSVDFTGRTSAFLSFEHYWLGVEFTYARVQVSNDGGSTWNTVLTYSNSTQGALATPAYERINISTYAANQADVRVRFQFDDGGGFNARFWYIDDVKLYADPDVGAVELVSPTHLGCALGGTYGSAETLSVRVQNFSADPVSNVPVTVEVLNDAGTLIQTFTDVVPGPIAGQQSVVHTLPGTLDMSADDVFHFQMQTTLATDAYLSNNSKTDGRRQYVQTSYPYVEDFRWSNSGWKVERTNPLNQDRNWEWGQASYLGGVGTNSDGFYVRNEANSGDRIYLLSPTFNLTSLSSPVISFDAKMDNQAVSYHLEYSLNGGTWQRFGTAAPGSWYTHSSDVWYGQAYTSWQNFFHDGCQVAGESCVQFRFVMNLPSWGGSIGANQYPFMIDNFRVEDRADVALVDIAPITITCDPNPNQAITFTVYNYSCLPIVNMPVTVNVTGAASATFNEFVGTGAFPIPPGGSYTYQTSGTFNMTTLGTYNIDVTTNHPPDINPSNNSGSYTVNMTTVKVNTFPYTADFNSGPQNWNAGAANTFAEFRHGTVPYLGGAAGLGQSWYLDDPTSGNSNHCWVQSPAFDFTNISKPRISFDVKYQVASGGWSAPDHVQVQFSTDGGTNWANLGSGPSATWYNTSASWAHDTSPIDVWTHKEIEVCEFSGLPCVIFRMRFNDAAGSGSQFAFDNFQITPGDDADLEAYSILSPQSGECGVLSSTEPVTVLLRNQSCIDRPNVPVRIDWSGPTGSGSFTETYNQNFVPKNGGNATFEMTGTIDMSLPGAYTITATTLYPSEINPANDSRTEVRYVNTPINSFPHIEDFNADNGGWRTYTADSTRHFAHKELMNYPHGIGGPDGQGHGWWLAMGSYGYEENVWVESPTYDLSALSSPILTMDVKYQLAPNDNKVFVEYSTDGGSSWTKLGDEHRPNWYNYADSWNHNSSTQGYHDTIPLGSWTRMEYGLCAVAGQSCVKFRVATEDLRTQLTGFSYDRVAEFGFDNFSIYDGVDVGVVDFLTPTLAACGFSTNETVTVVAHNWGCATATNVPVTCDITGPIPATLSGTIPSIPPQSSVTYVFPTTANLSNPGSYNLNAYTTLAGDIFSVNNATDTIIDLNAAKVTSFPYCEDFNGTPGLWYANNTSPGIGYVHGTLAPTYLGGPDGQGDSWYVQSGGAVAYLTSPVLDFTNVNRPRISFDAKHLLGGWSPWGSDAIRMEFSTDGGTTWRNNFPGVSGALIEFSAAENTNNWTHLSAELCELSGESCVIIRFACYDTWAQTGPDFAIDNICIEGEPADIEPIAITLSPAAGHDLQACTDPLTNAEQIQVLLRNNSCLEAVNPDLTITLTGPTGTQTFTEQVPSIPPYVDWAYYTFTNTVDMSLPGTYTLTAQTSWSHDGTPANDIHIETRHIAQKINSFPYNEDFNSGNGGWTTRYVNNDFANFLLDTLPPYHSNPDSLYLGGSQGQGACFYFDHLPSPQGFSSTWWPPNASGYVESPIFDFSSMTNPVLSFKAKRYMGSAWVRVEYRTNFSNTWHVLGTSASPGWYDAGNAFNGNFTDTLKTWTTYSHDLCNLAGENCVQLRIYGLSNVTEQSLFAFDDIQINNSLDLAVTQVISPSQAACGHDGLQPITLEVYSGACNVLTNVPIYFEVNGVAYDDIIPTLNPGTNTFTFDDPGDSVFISGFGSWHVAGLINYPGDVNPVNNRAEHTHTQYVVNSYPYCEDFNGASSGWEAGSNDNNGVFTLGALPSLNGPQGNGNSWYIEQGNNSDAWVVTPIFDLSQTLNPILKVDIKYSLTSQHWWANLRGYLQYSVDNGPWQFGGVGTYPDFFDNPAVWTTPNDGFWNNGNNPPIDQWKTISANLCEYVGEKCVRFRFYVQQFYPANEFAIDNFCIVDNPIDAAIVPNSISGCYSEPYPVSFTLEHVFRCSERVYLSDNVVTTSNVSTNNEHGGYPVTNVADAGGAGTQWSTGTPTLPAWVEVNLSTPQIINTLHLQGSSSGPTYFPRDWEFQAWDGSAWVTLDSRTGAALPQPLGTDNPFFFTNNTAYSRYRLYVTAVGGGTNYTNISVLGLYHSEPLVLNDIDIHYDIDGITGTQHFSGLNLLPGQVRDLQLAGLTVPGSGSTVSLCAKNPNFGIDHVDWNDCASTDMTTWPHCNDHCQYATQITTPGVFYPGQTNNATSSEVESGTYVYSANMAQGTAANSTGSYSTGTFDKVSDGNLVEGWAVHTPSAFPYWVEFDMGSPQMVNAYRIYCSSSQPLTFNLSNYNPHDFQFQAWDGSSWVTLDSRTAAGIPNDSWVEYAFANTTAYQRYRLYITAAQASGWLRVTEFEMYERTEVPPTQGEEPGFGCAGGIAEMGGTGPTLETTVWYRFETSDSLDVNGDPVPTRIEINNDGCVGGAGVQVSLLQMTGSTACDPASYTEVCWDEPTLPNGNPNPNFDGTTNYSIDNANGGAMDFEYLLSPNTQYYIAIDGSAGADCDFEIRLTGPIEWDILPVELSHFSGNCEAQHVSLQWQTASEFNAAHFEILRRHESQNTFEVIGQTLAQNTSQGARYTYVDAYAEEGLNYYRLRQRDLDGTAYYSQVIAVKDCGSLLEGQKTMLSLWPNPASESTTLELKSAVGGAAKLSLIDALGRVIEQRQVSIRKGQNAFKLPLMGLPAGSYLVELQHSQFTERVKLIVE